jgi:hypothetical protein
VQGCSLLLLMLLYVLQAATVSAVSEEVTASGSRLWLGNLVGSYVSYIDLGQSGDNSSSDSQHGATDREEL